MDRPGTRVELTLDDDVMAAVERLQEEHGIDVDEALNLLARRGISGKRRAGSVSSGGPVAHDVLSVHDAQPPFHPPR